MFLSEIVFGITTYDTSLSIEFGKEILDIMEVIHNGNNFEYIKDNEFIYPNILENFHRKDESDECYEGTVFGYVPKDLVEDLYNYLNNFN